MAKVTVETPPDEIPVENQAVEEAQEVSVEAAEVALQAAVAEAHAEITSEAAQLAIASAETQSAMVQAEAASIVANYQEELNACRMQIQELTTICQTLVDRTNTLETTLAGLQNSVSSQAEAETEAIAVETLETVNPENGVVDRPVAETPVGQRGRLRIRIL